MRFIILSVLMMSTYVMSAQMCLSCKGLGITHYNKRVPKYVTKTYDYYGQYTDNYSVTSTTTYGSELVTETCSSCNGTGNKPRKGNTPTHDGPWYNPKPTKRTTSFTQQVIKKYGQSTEFSDINALEGYYKISYKKNGESKQAIIARDGFNGHRIIVGGAYTHLSVYTDEDEKFLLFGGKRGDKYYLLDEKGKVVYQTEYSIFPINRAGDAWMFYPVGHPKLNGRTDFPNSGGYILSNYKTNETLVPGKAFDRGTCLCKYLWTKYKLIDVYVLQPGEKRYSTGFMNEKGEMVIPPVFTGIYDCLGSNGKVRLYDRMNYIHDFTTNGNYYYNDKPKEITCSDEVKASSTMALYIEKEPEYDRRRPKIYKTNIIELSSKKYPNIDGLAFSEFNCFDEDKWSKVKIPKSSNQFALHLDGTLAKVVQGKENFEEKVAEQPKLSTDFSNDDWFELIESNGRFGALLKFGINKRGKLVTKKMKTKYKQIILIGNRRLKYQTMDGKWGVRDYEEVKYIEIKAEYDEFWRATGSDSYISRKGKEYFNHWITSENGKYVFKKKSLGDLNTPEGKETLLYLDFDKKIPNLGDNLFELLVAREVKPKEISNHVQYEMANGFMIGDNIKMYLSDYGARRIVDFPSGTKALLPPVKRLKQWFIPFQAADGKWRIKEIFKDQIDRVMGETMVFDDAYLLKLGRENQRATLILEKDNGYYTIDVEKFSTDKKDKPMMPVLHLYKKKL